MSVEAAAPEPKYDILSPTFFADPHPTLHRMRDEDPAYFHPLLRAWVLTRYDDVLRVVRDPGTHFSARRVEQYGVGAPQGVRDKLQVYNQFLATWLNFLDPPEHTRLRAPLAKAFTVQAVERLRPRIQGIVDDLLATAKERGRIDYVAEFATPLPLLVFSELMGVPPADMGQIQAWIGAVMQLLGVGLPDASHVDAGHDGVVNLRAYFGAAIAERRVRPTEDLLSKLAEARVDGDRLSDDELVGMAVMLFLAGQDTNIHTQSGLMIGLLRMPDVLQRLRGEQGLTDAVLEELLRHDGPTFGTFRRAVVDQDGPGGVKIAAGDYILNCICAANRDPRRFPDPDHFDSERPDNRHLQFSGGLHFCPGAAMSRLQIRIAIRSLLAEFSDIQIDADALEWVPGLMLRGVKALPLVLTPA
jgi:cytochrome P450